MNTLITLSGLIALLTAGWQFMSMRIRQSQAVTVARQRHRR